MRGFLGGVAIGALVSGLGAALASLAVPLPRTIDVSSENPLTIGSPESVTPVPEERLARDADLVEAAPVVSEEPSISDEIAALDPQLRTPATKPEVGHEITALPDVEVSPTPVPDIKTTTDSSSGLPDVVLALPDAPVGEAPPIIETTSAALPEYVSPVISVEDTPVAAEPSDILTSREPIEPEALDIADAGVTTTPVVVTSPEVDATKPTEATQPVAPKIILDVPQIEAPDVDTGIAALTLPQIVTPTLPRSLPENVVEDTDPQPEGQDEIRPRFVKPGDGPASQVAEAVTEDAVQPQPDAPAFVRNAEEFIALDDRPLMSIVLIDDADSIGAEALEEFPYALTFAIRADDPQAAAKAEARRAAGFEVLMLIDLPRDAGPREAETAMEVWTPKLPQAVGILEGVGTGFQGNRALADQVTALSAAGGLGLVTQAKGFNTVQKLAQRDGVPSGIVFRDFDGAGQNPRAIRRFLDQAAFRAKQEGAVIMLGRLQPDTISALLLWGLQDRANRVQLAPVSASLRTGSGEG